MSKEIHIMLRERQDRVEELGLRVAAPGESNIDFTLLAEASVREPNVLPVSVRALEETFQSGMSAVFVQENQAVGHVRFLPLLTQRLKADLEISDQVPQIWEMGTGLMLEEYRGKGINIVLRHALISRFQEQMQSGQLLALATTKTPELRSLVDNVADLMEDQGGAYPVDFRFTHRENIPFIAPFTCVCTPDFGNGYQFGTDCSQAEIAGPQTLGFRRGRELPIIGQGSANEKNKIACTVIVSSTLLAEQTDRLLGEHFGSRQNLVNNLMERRYFE